jgi:hypothetical protein
MASAPKILIVAAICLASAYARSQIANAPQPDSPHLISLPKGPPMTNHATGTFDVKMTPQKPDNKPAEAANLGRMSIDKQFLGDLEATSQGEMLSFMTNVKGSGVYVAIERVTGTLHGRSGSFALHHTGIMTRGIPQMSVTVVPDSATGDLVGLSGSMTIKIEEGKHFYEFDYAPPEAH